MSSADERIINRLQRIYEAQGAGGASFEELTGEPTDNAALGTALNAKVPTSRTVNGQALSGNVVVTGLMLDTTGAPDNGVGANGDYAFDDATKTIYGPKAAGVWPAGVVLGARGGYSTTATDDDVTVLTADSNRIQRASGFATQTFQLPVTSTLYLGFDFLFINRSTEAITLTSSGGNTVLIVPSGASAFAVCTSITGTTAASWAAEQISDYAALDSPAFTGTPTAPTQGALDNSTKLATTSYADAAAAAAAAASSSSGTYAPSFSASVNLDSDPTPLDAQWLRVGNTVTVSGKIAAIDITLPTTLTSFRITLPVASNFALDSQAGGTAASNSVAGQVAAIKARVGGDVIFEWVSIGTASQEMFYSFTYLVVSP